MRRVPLDRDALRAWVRGAYLHPNANWFVPIFDVRRRGLVYLAHRDLMLADEPNMAIGPALERLLARFERGDRTLRVLSRMDDEERVRLVLEFIVSREDREVRDDLLRRFAARPSIVFGWRPGSLEDFVLSYDDAGQETDLARAYREFLERACETHVDVEIRRRGLDRGPVYQLEFD